MGSTDTGAVDGAVKNIQSKSAAKSSGLSGSVGFKGANAPDDVWKVSSALHANGLMEAPQRHADNALFTSITKAQENMDYNLKRDGLVNPGGPTESTYTRYLSQGFMKPPSNTAGDDKLDSDGYKPLGTAGDVLKREHEKEQAEAQRARVIQQQERRQEREREDAAKRATAAQNASGLNSGLSNTASAKQEAVKTAAQGLAALAGKTVSALTGENTPTRHPREGGDPGAPASQMDSRMRGNDELVADRKVPILSDEAYASNRRTADALGKYKGVGDLPRFTTDAINTNGEKAVHEVADLIGQVHGRDQDQAKELFDKTAQGIAPENRALLKQAMDGHIANLKTESPDAVSPSAPQGQITLAGGAGNGTIVGGAGADILENQTEDMKSPDDLMLEPGDRKMTRREWIEYLKESSPKSGPFKDVLKSALIEKFGNGQDVKDNLSTLSQEYRAKGYSRAADNLDHFLHGKGADAIVPRDEARKDPFIADGEKRNRHQFEERTFLGLTGDDQVNIPLRNLKDGQTVSLNDKWDHIRGGVRTFVDMALGDVSKQDDALAEGSKSFISKVNFTATRHGDKIVIEGNVRHDGSEPYDFESIGLGNLMGAKRLADTGLAHDFNTRRIWGQHVVGTVDVAPGPHGNILSNPRFKWEDTWKDSDPADKQ